MGILGVLDRLESNIPLFNWVNVTGSVEAINFQTNSSFPQELTEVMQNIIDFAAEHDSSYGEVKTSDEALIKHTRIKAYITSNAEPRLQKIIFSHTGVEVVEFIVSLPTNTDAATAVFCMLSETNTTLSEILKSTSGFAEDELDATKNLKLAQLLDLSYSLDRDKGKIRAGVRRLKVKIGLPVGIFTLKDIMPGELFGNNDIDQLTASEIAAVILHEIGHVFSWVETMADLNYAGYYGNNRMRLIADKFEKSPNEVIKATIKLTDEIIVKSKNNKDFTNFTKFAIKAKELLSSMREINTDDKVKPNLGDKATYKSNLGQLFGLIIVKLIIGVIAIIESGVFYQLWGIMRYTIFSDAHSTREFGGTNQSVTMYERLADEYVSRFKMSKELNSALEKIYTIHHQMSKLGFGHPVFNATIRNSLIARMITIVATAPWNIITFLYTTMLLDGRGSYEAEHVRAKRNISNLHDVLKQSKLPPSVRNELLVDIDIMEKELNSMSMVVPALFANVIKIILRFPFKAGASILSTVFGNTNLDSEYMNLMNRLDDAMSNKAAYHAAKIQNIFDNA